MIEKETSMKERILRSASELFLKNGYHETTMSAIANHAEVGKGTLYWYFSSKDELFKTMVWENANIFFEGLKILVTKPLSPDLILREFIEVGVKSMQKNRDFAHIFFNNIRLTDEEFKQKLFIKFKEIVNMVELVIERGIAEGIFRPCSSKYVALLIVGTIKSAGGSLFDQNIQNQSEMIDFAYNMILHGIISDD
ncbi:MAG: TetR/AcrR family transcriptional regulator [Halanaerobiales bacterium]|nr:TetR/AcrR family transcriptional regulator [Halanaerobiales bacterium]